MTEKLQHKIILNSLKWIAVVKLSGQMVSWLITLVVVRFVTPDEYGLVATAGIVLGMLNLLHEVGIGPAIIYTKDLDKSLLRNCQGFLLLVGSILAYAVFRLAPNIAIFFQNERLVVVLQVMALQFVLQPIGTIPRALLDKEFEFKKRATVELTSNLLASLVTLTMAVLGQGVWALVVGNLVTLTSTTAGYLITSKTLYLPTFNIWHIRRLLSYGAYITLEQIAWYIGTQLDALVISKLLGVTPLGLYTFATTISSSLVDKISPILGQVLFPAYCKIKDDESRIVYWYMKTVQLIAFISFIIFFGLSALSDQVVQLLFGPRWAKASIIVSIFALYMPFKLIGILSSPVFKSLGKTKILAKLQSASTISIGIAAALGSFYGLHGVAILVLISNMLFWFIKQSKMSQLIGVSTGAMFRSIATFLIPGIIAFIAMKSVPGGWNSVLTEILTKAGAGLAVYLFGILITDGHFLGGILTTSFKSIMFIPRLKLLRFNSEETH